MLLMCVPDQEEQKPKKNVIRQAVEKCGKVYDFQPLKDKQLHGFIEKRLRASGKNYRPSVVSAIISNSGYGNKAINYSLYNLDNDLKKVIAYSGEEITAYDVGAVLSVNPENNVFAMLDAIGRNRKDEALRLLYNLLESGTTVFSLLRMITGQLELILSIKEMKENGMNLTQIQKKLGVHQFRVKKAAAVGGNCSVSYLKNILSEAYQVDEHIKTGLFDGAAGAGILHSKAVKNIHKCTANLLQNGKARMDGFCRKGGNQHGHRVLESGGTLGAFLFFRKIVM